MSPAWQIEIVALYLPILLSLILLFCLQTHRRIKIGLVLTCGWQIAALPPLNLWAQSQGYWSFHSEAPALFGIPLSLYFGWVILWGLGIPLIAGRLPLKWPMSLTLIGAVILDLITMPLMEPVLVLGEDWLKGEVLLILFALIPGLILAHFTFLDQAPKIRALLISIAFTLLTLGVLPFVTEPDLSSRLTSFAAGLPNSLHLLTFAILILLGVPAMAAVREFAVVGKGTPIPFDPPKQLVTTGIYAYLNNPMQSSLVASLLLWSFYLGNSIALGLALSAFIYSIGFARWSESVELQKKHGANWQDYQRATRAWFPTFLPLPQAQTSLIFFDLQCGPCRAIASWFQKRSLTSLEIQDANLRSGPALTRVTYQYPNGLTLSGVEAISAALFHLHLGWAWIGSLARLPIILSLAEISFGQSFTSSKSRRPDSHN